MKNEQVKMGEINVTKPSVCLICDSDIQLSQSYSLFYTFITNTGVLLADSLEKNLSLKDIGSLPLRSNFLCLKCFEYFKQLSDCEEKIVKLKGDLWAVYKETCKKRGEQVETHVKGTSTQTDFSELDCECKSKKNLTMLNLKKERLDEDRNLIDEGVNQDHEGSLEIRENEIKLEREKPTEEVSVDADTHCNQDDPSKWKRRPESCKLCGKWFKKVVELDNHMLVHVEMDKKSGKDGNVSRTRKKFHSCSVCDKKFRRPCEVKDHMLSHNSATPFICKYCGKNLKSKTGAVYHALKSHRIDVGNNKNLGEHFYLDVGKEKDSKKDDSDDEENCKNGNEGDSDFNKDEKDAGADTSSSEDELPLARRRKEFIYEKIKQEINNENRKGASKRPNSTQKQVLHALKQWTEVSVTKVSKTSEDGLKKKIMPLTKVKQEDGSPSAGEKIDKGEIRSKETDLSKTNEVTIQNISESKNSDMGSAQTSKLLSNVDLSEKSRTRAKKYPLSTLLKLKKQKDSGLFPPPMKEPKFKCDICGKMWKTRGELNAHKITHSDARPYICEICGQAYKHKPALDVHVGMHRGIYHHQCPYCQKAFTQKGALQRHLPIHTGDLPYQCELCGKRFVHRTSFSIHTMAHTGVRNIRCKICNLGVLSKSHLRRHMRIHTGEKPYECQTCGKAFAERYNLVAHQRIHDPNLSGPARQQKKKIQTCRLCTASFDKRYKLEEHMVTVHNKVVDEPPRSSVFDTGESFTASRVTAERFDERKQQEREEPGEKADINIVSTGNPNEITVRNLQSLQNLRNLELLRNLENNRSFELIRVANGISGMDETIRIPVAGQNKEWKPVHAFLNYHVLRLVRKTYQELYHVVTYG